MSSLIVVFFLSAFLISKVSSECLTYNFEDKIDEFLINEHCQLPAWVTDVFDEFESPFSSQSKTFISPRVEMSCVSSRSFSVHTDGTFEINVVMMPSENAFSDLIAVQIMSTVSGTLVGSASLNAVSDVISPDGYQVMSINWNSEIEPGAYEIYVVFMGMAAEDSRVLIDSLRYIPPGSNPEDQECLIYNDFQTLATESSATELTTTESSTTDPSITETNTTESSTTEPNTTEPNTTEPNTTELNTTSEPESENQSTSKPTYPEVSDDTFWMTLALVSVSLLCFTIMGVLSYTFYRCGQRRMLSKLQQNYLSTDNLPKPIEMPRARIYNNYDKNNRFNV